MRAGFALLPAAVAMSAVLGVACSSPPSDAPSPPAAAATTAAAQPTATAEPADAVASAVPLWTDAQVAAALVRLGEFDFDARDSILEYATASKDRRMIAPLIGLLRFWAPNEMYQQIDHALLNITGESHDGEWIAWVEWMGRQDDVPIVESFARWKGEILASRVDRGFLRFLDGTQPTKLRVELIQWGGVRVDGIPALNNPKFVTAEEADYLTPGEPVFGIVINGDVRAYPLRILDWHELANDVVGGVAVSLAYCTLCGAGVLYETETEDWTFTFGSSGLLYESNKLMYDRQTDTLWNQLTGEPVHGALAFEGIELKRRPIVVTDWADWVAEHPQTKVLDIDTGYVRDYTPGEPYGNYFASEETMFPAYQRSQALAPKAWIYALLVDGTPKAYPLTVLQQELVANDTLAGQPVVLVANPDSRAVRAYERGDFEFSKAGAVAPLLDSTGRAWTVTEDALLGPGGETLARLPGHLAYWFGWFSFYPRTQIYGDGDGTAAGAAASG